MSKETKTAEYLKSRLAASRRSLRARSLVCAMLMSVSRTTSSGLTERLGADLRHTLTLNVSGGEPAGVTATALLC